MTETLLCLNPGPSTLVVISLGMTRGQAAGIVAASGVLAANAVYFRSLSDRVGSSQYNFCRDVSSYQMDWSCISDLAWLENDRSFFQAESGRRR